ncbi:MAG: hypothetical protein ACKOZW_08230 [Cyanobium sp.]
MTVSEGSGARAAGLVLVAVGAQPALAERLAAATERLGSLSGWPRHPLASDRPPAEALGALPSGRATQAPPAWIAPLPVDPGLGLESGGCWAEALGAFRQPTALVLGAAQLASGWPAAATALLRQEGVPLVGLIQVGGAWEPERRRGEGLPWLGWLGGAGGQPVEDGQEVLAALAQRWRRLDLL